MHLPNHGSLLVATLLASGCAHAPQTARSEAPFRAFECPADEAGEARSFGEALKLALDVDSLEVVAYGGHQRFTVAERGTACSGATDRDACQAELARHKDAWAQAQAICDDDDACEPVNLVVTTRKGEVAQWAHPGRLLELLGAIDTPADAWLLLMSRSGYSSFECGDASSNGYREVPQGFELLRRKWVSSCRPIEQVEIVELFKRDGSVTPVRQRIIEHEPDGCYKP